MNLSRKIAIGTLATGILLSPLVNESHQADATTGENWNPTTMKQTGNAQNEYEVTFSQWINGDKASEDMSNRRPQLYTFAYDQNLYTVILPKEVTKAQFKELRTIDESIYKDHKMQTKIIVEKHGLTLKFKSVKSVDYMGASKNPE